MIVPGRVSSALRVEAVSGQASTMVAYEDWRGSRAAGPPILFLHGLLMSPDMWRACLDGTPLERRALLVSQPGHAGSAPPPSAFSMPDWASWIEAIRQALGIERFDCVGHSMGGMAAAAYAVAFPGRVRRLVIVSSDLTAAGWLERAMMGFSAGMIERWSDRDARRVMGSLFGRSYLQSRPQESEAWRRSVDGLDRSALRPLIRAVANRRDLLGALGALALPVGILHGRVDRVIPARRARAMARQIPNARIEIQDTVGHCPPLERPSETATALARWLAE